jgi:serine/threonine-protein kinase
MLWTALPLIETRLPDPSLKALAIGIGALLLATGVFGAWARESLMKTAFNRRMFFSAIVAMLLPLAMLAGAYLAGLDAAMAEVLLSFVGCAVLATLAASFDRRMAAAAITYMVAFLGSMAWPAQRHYFLAGANASLMITLLVLWLEPLWR